MNAERVRTFLLGLPHVVETEQWGGLLFWVGDKAIGGKTFAMVNLTPGEREKAISFSAGPERFSELLERDGIIPAPYSAKNFWVAAERWNALLDREWEGDLRAAHALTFAKLPPRTKAILALPPAEQKKILNDWQKLLAGKAGPKTSANKRAKKQSE